MSRKKLVTFRVTEQERRSYSGIADRAGKSLGELIRYLLDREITMERVRSMSSAEIATTTPVPAAQRD